MVEGHTNWTTMFLQMMFLICSVCNTYGVASTASPLCTSDEYRVGQVCCLACPAGYRVRRDCTATTSSLCSKCPDGTFKEDLSGQKQCTACTKCDKGLGLKVKRSCSSTSDAECEALDGFFCSDSADNDTFSKATLSCQPHTMCGSVGGVQIKPGTDSTDSTCFPYVTIVFIIIGCISFIILLVLGALVYRRLKMERDLTEFEKQIHEMETPEQVKACDNMRKRLQKRKKKPEQEGKLRELIHLYYKKMKTLKRERAHYGGAAGEATSGPSSTPLLSTELPAGLETSSPPAPSSETQSAEETTPLMSSESPEPTRDQQEHTSRTTTPDGHDDDQSLGPEVIRRDIGTSQSIPSTSQSVCRSGAGEGDIEMGPVPGSDHKSHKST